MQLKPVRYRRRPAWSCLECRRRKVKCDRNQPCRHCTAQSKECIFKTYRDGPSEAPRPAPTVLIPVQRAAAPAPSPAPRAATTYPVPAPRDPALVLPSISARGDFLSRPREAPAVRQQGNGEQLNPVTGLSETSRELIARQMGLEGRQILLNKTRTLRWSHFSGVAKEVRYTIVLDLDCANCGSSLGLCFGCIRGLRAVVRLLRIRRRISWWSG